MATKEIQILMIGPSGVGKTSLLTSMCQLLDNASNDGMRLYPVGQTNVDIHNKLEELKSPFNDKNNDEVEVREEEWVKGGADVKYYKFNLKEVGKSDSILDLNFVDPPGGWFLSSVSSQREKAEELLRDSRIILITVDSPAMMEPENSKDSGEWMDFVNKPEGISKILGSNLNFSKHPNKLIIFCPVKCEKYMDSQGKSIQLIEKLEKYYKNLIIDLRHLNSKQNQVCVVITPVQTIGTVLYKETTVIDKHPIFKFKKKTFDVKYSPKDCDQPLKFILSYLLKSYLDEMGTIWRFIYDTFGWNETIRNGIQNFSESRKENEIFKILSGKNLL